LKSIFPSIAYALRQGRKKTRSACLGKLNVALGQVKMEVWCSSGQVKLALVVLLVIISNQNQEKQNNELMHGLI